MSNQRSQLAPSTAVAVPTVEAAPAGAGTGDGAAGDGADTGGHRRSAIRGQWTRPAALPRPTKQEQMTFQPVTRGRFEKSEPTIVDGQDLDVPAFMRRNVRVKP